MNNNINNKRNKPNLKTPTVTSVAYDTQDVRVYCAPINVKLAGEEVGHRAGF